MQLSKSLLSENLLIIQSNPALEIVEGPFPFEFDEDGQLPELLRPEKMAAPQGSSALRLAS